MKITVLGSGGSSQTVKRSCASYLIDDKMMVDAGPGSYRNLLKSGNDPLQIKALLLSHLHGDHFFDLGTLVWGMSYFQRTVPLTVVGPSGTSAMVRSLLSMANTPASFMKFNLNVVEIKAGESMNLLGFTVTTAPGTHTIEDIAYRIGNLCYTGDTSPSDSIVNLASGCGLLIHESSGFKENEDVLQTVGHSSSRQAAMVAKRANAKRLLLAHIIPLASARSKELLGQALQEFKDTEVAEDLMTLDL